MTFIARKSSHIQEDIKRNWSSWNFGEGGFEGTYSELQNKIKEALESESSLFISGFELWDNDIKKADIRELYTNYWVLVDNTNGYGNGIFGTELKAESLRMQSRNLNQLIIGERVLDSMLHPQSLYTQMMIYIF
jgi:hypothetical protein